MKILYAYMHAHVKVAYSGMIQFILKLGPTMQILSSQN